MVVKNNRMEVLNAWHSINTLCVCARGKVISLPVVVVVVHRKAGWTQKT